MRKYRLAALASHPIQYQVPLWRRLASCPEVDLTVLYGSDFGVSRPVIAEFKVPYRWDIPLLEGYRFRFLRNVSLKPSLRGFWGIVNIDLYDALKTIQPDILLLQGYSRFMDWHALWSARLLGIRVFLRGESSLLIRRTRKDPLRAFLVAKAFLSKIDALLAIGTDNRNFYLSVGVLPRQVFDSPYTVDNDFFRNCPREPREKLRERLGLPSDRVIFLGVGSLIPRKGVHDLIEAYGKMRDYDQAAVVWVGEGAERSLLEAQRDSLPANASVILAGFKNQTELPSYYAAADVFVLPSYEETWGLVINEAMNFGLPIVTTDRVGAAVDLVCQKVNGFVYPAGDVTALAEILELMLDCEQVKQMGQASSLRINGWTLNETVQGILNGVRVRIDDGDFPD